MTEHKENTPDNNGKFIISLDFEMLWGVRDVVGIKEYGQHIKGVHQVIPRLLKMFTNYQIKGTFAIVGFLFFENKNELLDNLPKKIPHYANKSLSPYEGHFDFVGENFHSDPYHFAPQLFNRIKSSKEHEIGTHTFSHYYCLEGGQTEEDFSEDIFYACKAAARQGLQLTSLVFPRNQFNDRYIKVIKDAGIICYRGNEKSWIYKALNAEKESLFRRAIRLLDAYINLSGFNCYSDKYLKDNSLINIPSSRFLRPYTKRLKLLEPLRLKRIKNGMTYAAKNNATYHLWWHPHNFGINQKENFSFLEKILKHYQVLNAQYNFQSYTMSQLAKSILNDRS